MLFVFFVASRFFSFHIVISHRHLISLSSHLVVISFRCHFASLSQNELIKFRVRQCIRQKDNRFKNFSQNDTSQSSIRQDNISQKSLSQKSLNQKRQKSINHKNEQSNHHRNQRNRWKKNHFISRKWESYKLLMIFY